MNPPHDDPAGTWVEYSKYILIELERLNDRYKSIDKRLQKNDVDIAMLKVKATAWGMLGGLIPGAIAILMWCVKGSK